jgi:tRNA A37 threonylcarbamoyladenosine modification protein TsaB
MTTARTLAHTLNKPLIGVSSLAALARPTALWLSEVAESRTVIIATTDACKGELFALYGSAKSVSDCVVMSDGDRPGLWKRGVEEQVLTADELMKGVKKKLAEGDGKAKWIALGEGRKRYEEDWKKLPKSREIEAPSRFSEHIHQVQGRYVGMLAWEAFQTGLAREALRVHPRYLRAPDAELKLKAGLLKRA